MVPGDMIEWVYKFNNEIVEFNERLWSSLMKEWVPIGEPALLISKTSDAYFWLNSKGLFHARVDDTYCLHPDAASPAVVPRARG